MSDSTLKIAVFDIDGTLYRWSFFIEMIERLVKLGKISGEAYESARVMKASWRKREASFTDYSDAIIGLAESKAMKTVSCEDVMDVAREIVDEQGRNVYVFTRELFTVVKDHGYRTVAISGSIREAVELFAETWGIDDVIATELEHENGFYTGKTYATPVRDKGKALRAYLSRQRAQTRVMLAVGDTCSDLSILRMAEFPIAFNPENKLRAHARAHGLVCVTERKDCLTVLSAPGLGQDKRVPRFFSENSLANVLPRDIGMELKARLWKLGYEHH